MTRSEINETVSSPFELTALIFVTYFTTFASSFDFHFQIFISNLSNLSEYFTIRKERKKKIIKEARPHFKRRSQLAQVGDQADNHFLPLARLRFDQLAILDANKTARTRRIKSPGQTFPRHGKGIFIFPVPGLKVM